MQCCAPQLGTPATNHHHPLPRHTCPAYFQLLHCVWQSTRGGKVAHFLQQRLRSAAIRFNCRSTARATFLACKGSRWLDVALSYSVTYTRAPRRRAVPEQRGELSPSTSSTACKEQVPYDVISKLGRVLRRPDRERADQLHALKCRFIYPVNYPIIYNYYIYNIYIYDRSSSSKLGVPPKGIYVRLIMAVWLGSLIQISKKIHTHTYIQQTVDWLHINQLIKRTLCLRAHAT